MLSGCSKGKPVESASLTTSADSYSYVIYENGKIESKKKNDYEEIQSQEDFIDLTCAVARFISNRTMRQVSQNSRKISSLTSDVNLLDFINNPLSFSDVKSEIVYKKNKSVKLSEAKQKLSKLNEILFLRYQRMRHNVSESGEFERTQNDTVVIQNGKVACGKTLSEMKKN